MPLEYVVALNCFFLRGLAGALQHHSTMMDYALNALAPKLEVGQEALYDALRSRDSKRAARIIERVANNHRAQSRTGATAAGTLQREKEVGRSCSGEFGTSIRCCLDWFASNFSRMFVMGLWKSSR